MGWWGYDILEGDGPLDAVGLLEEAVGWSYDLRGYDIHDDCVRNDAIQVLAEKKAREKAFALVRKMARRKDDVVDGSIIAVVKVLLDLNVKPPKDIVRITLRSIDKDEFADQSGTRMEKLNVFSDVLLKAAGIKTKATTYDVRVTRTVVTSSVVPIVADSAKNAEKLAIDVARDENRGTVDHKVTAKVIRK